MTAYIAGKITGDPQFLEKFEYTEQQLTARGLKVLNPAILPKGLTPKQYMKICFAMIDASDVVYFLNDYKESAGAMLEWNYCQYTNKNTMGSWTGAEIINA